MRDRHADGRVDGHDNRHAVRYADGRIDERAVGTL